MSTQTMPNSRGNMFTGTARSTINTFWFLGAVLLAVGGIVFGASAADGSPGGTIMGVVAAVAGQFLLFIAIIATGVRLGIESATRRL